MPDSFDLLVWADTSVLEAGVDSVILSETGNLRPPGWADRVKVFQEESEVLPDAILFLLGERPSASARAMFFKMFRLGVPVGALVSATDHSSEPVFSKLKEWERLWLWQTRGDLIALLQNTVEQWICSINRDLDSYPSGEELIQSWNGVAGESVDMESLLRAFSILRNRGFVCLSGSMGAGKTTLARLLLMEAADEGLVPMEHIDSNVSAFKIERLLRGPDDCILLFDIDSIRRQTEIHPLHLFHSVLTVILRATDSRRRVVLTSSDPRMAGLFSLFGDAHVILPAPEENRQWRIEEGEKALSAFKNLDLFSKAELVLLSLFEPIVSETLFRSSLFEIWSRLHFLLRETFPRTETLEEMYSKTRASRGVTPFRRLSVDGVIHLCSGDTLLLSAVDRGLADLSGGGSPLIRVVMETLLNSSVPEQRRAGYSIAHMYRHLSSSEKSRLLFTASKETIEENVTDFFAMLLSDREAFDRASEGLCRHILDSGQVELRRALALALGNPWLRKDHYFRDLVEAAAADEDELVRGNLLQSIDMWGVAGDPGGFVETFLLDRSPVVRRVLLFLLGRRFPRLSEGEMAIVNDALSVGSNDDELTELVRGLMNRQMGEFDQESCDLLWLLMHRLPEGGRGIVAFTVGARIRFFDPEIRNALFTDIGKNDIHTVAQCMLMSYEDLSTEEKSILWHLIAEHMPVSNEMAAMVLPYVRILEEDEQRTLLKLALTGEGFGGRESLSQLLAGGREDVAWITLDVVNSLLNKGSVEERLRLPWFLLWNRDSLGEPAWNMLGMLAADDDASVRKAMAFGIRRLGLSGEKELKFLNRLSGDSERSVRAAAGEALAELAESEELFAGQVAEMCSDSDPFVRMSILRGANCAEKPDIQAKTRFFVSFLDDSDSSVRLQAVNSISELQSIPEVPKLAEKLASLLSDRSEEVRDAVVTLVTGHPSVTTSRTLREKLPDLYLGRHSGGDSLAVELNTARQLQMGLLPEAPPEFDGYDIGVYYSSAREVGGDYYDFFNLPGRNLGLAVADVSGKGIPAALTMAGMKGTLGASVQSIFDITKIVSQVNNELTMKGEASSLVGMFYGVLDTRNGLLTFCNAGHNPPLLIRRDGSVEELETGGILMGVMENAPYSMGTRQIHSGDVLVMYTDGITETMDENDVEYGVSGLTDTVLRHRDLGADQIVDRILKAVKRHGGSAAQADDRTLVVVKHR
ncbi:hypothetical protein CSA37_02815 [Candidatus Fermentibacteria bacterium]|nr:MAG: hypothetical protein CSA37_02815 [Candidatus Fermentibacteria bacterium]